MNPGQHRCHNTQWLFAGHRPGTRPGPDLGMLISYPHSLAPFRTQEILNKASGVNVYFYKFHFQKQLRYYTSFQHCLRCLRFCFLFQETQRMNAVCSITLVVSDSAIPWTVAHQSPLSVEFSKHESWSGLPRPSPRPPRLSLLLLMLFHCGAQACAAERL